VNRRGRCGLDGVVGELDLQTSTFDWLLASIKLWFTLSEAKIWLISASEIYPAVSVQGPGNAPESGPVKVHISP
jgi:hypothetical protein